MTDRIQPSDPAPDFSVEDVLGNPVRLQDHRGRPCMLSFYRFASCPFCNLRVHRLLQHYDDFARQGLRMIAVFQSSPELIRSYVAQQNAPFPIVADPGKVLYTQYGVESSRKAVARASVRRLPDAARAMAKGFVPTRIDGDTALVPADFLIDEDGVVRVAYYGRDIGDHLPIERIASFLRVASAGAGRHDRP